MRFHLISSRCVANVHRERAAIKPHLRKVQPQGGVTSLINCADGWGSLTCQRVPIPLYSLVLKSRPHRFERSKFSQSNPRIIYLPTKRCGPNGAKPAPLGTALEARLHLPIPL